ncbi:ribosomal protein S18-alanine N-acetyltransferase [Microbacterium amylolyticum]|uniref:Ribosomal-protein-alanine acetyltransferase n=1 Tax=Microbacterium amylolyticum TaxID=936337 RepID=A0ABS4ZJN4_9MICO|nr:ribosomal protein S18-alanine N-acetyltransferase [Microbacterium amylolyticum]MBP2437402.1 ribosomal-protein-alanine acetyltransferase [Microbacterium amylolyticum]
MTIRVATIADVGAIMAIEQASFPADAWSESLMRAELENIAHGRYFVLEQGNHVLGYAGLRHLPGGKDADVQTIAVSDAARGRGQGRALLRTLLEEADARRAREVFLDVRADNAVAHALYVSEGFTELGRRPRYYQPDDVDAVVMRLDIASWRGAQAANQKEQGACS